MRGPETGSEDRAASPARPGWKGPIVFAAVVAGSCLAVVALAVAAVYIIVDDGGAESESPAQEGDFVLELTSITRP